MSLLTRATTPRPVPAPADRPPALRSPATVGALAGVQAATAGLFAVVVPCLLAWLAAPSVSASWVEAARVGADAWLVAHGATLVLPAGEISLVPLGLTMVPLLASWFAGRRVARALEQPSSPVALRPAAMALAALAGAYAVLTGLVAVVVATPSAHPVETRAALGGAAVAVLGGGAGLRPVLAGRTALPAAVAVPLRAAAIALAAWLGASAVLVAVGLVLGWSRATSLAQALDAGAVGGAGLLLLQLALLPVAVVWAGAWWAGPGFAVGTGSMVTPAGTGVGVLPAVPVLGALPEPGTHPGWMWLGVAVPLLCGVLAGRWLCRGCRGHAGRPWVLLRDVLVTAVATGVGAATLSAWASGAVGTGRMAHLGPEPGWVALTLGGEVLAGCLLGVVLPARRSARSSATPRDHRPDWLPGPAWLRLPRWLREPIRMQKVLRPLWVPRRARLSRLVRRRGRR